MRKEICIKEFSLAFVLIYLIFASSFAMLVAASSTTDSLDASEAAATWVISQAENATLDGGGYKWKDYGMGIPISPYYIYPATYYGAEGIGTFLLALYERTKNQTYLDYAVGAAQWICNVAVPENGGYKWPHPDADIYPPYSPGWWLSPDVAVIGDFLLKMYNETRIARFLDYAKGAAQWLISVKEQSDTAGSFIPYNPPGKYGSQAGHPINPGRESQTVLFLLDMYQETNNASYRQTVEQTATWLMYGAESGYPLRYSENGGYKWQTGIPYFGKPQPTDFALSSTYEVGMFFLKVYSFFNNETYLENAKGAIQWLLSQMVDGRWPSYPNETSYNLLECQDYENRVMDLLLSAYSMMGNETYLDYAKKYTDWIISQAVLEGNSCWFPSSQGSNETGSLQNARIYAYLCTMYSQTNNSTYSNYADKVREWLLGNATNGYPGLKWEVDSGQWKGKYDNPDWWGTSGVGYYLMSPLITTVEVIPELSTALIIQLLMVLLGLALWCKRQDDRKQAKLPFLFQDMNCRSRATNLSTEA